MIVNLPSWSSSWTSTPASYNTISGLNVSKTSGSTCNYTFTNTLLRSFFWRYNNAHDIWAVHHQAATFSFSAFALHETGCISMCMVAYAKQDTMRASIPQLQLPSIHHRPSYLLVLHPNYSVACGLESLTRHAPREWKYLGCCCKWTLCRHPLQKGKARRHTQQQWLCKHRFDGLLLV